MFRRIPSSRHLARAIRLGPALGLLVGIEERGRADRGLGAEARGPSGDIGGADQMEERRPGGRGQLQDVLESPPTFAASTSDRRRSANEVSEAQWTISSVSAVSRAASAAASPSPGRAISASTTRSRARGSCPTPSQSRSPLDACPRRDVPFRPRARSVTR